MSADNEPEIFGHPDYVRVGPDGVFIGGHVHGDYGDDGQKVADALAEQFDQSPDDFTISRVERRTSSTGRTIVGFSNWDGCNWEPQGPQGDPNLN